MPSRSDYLSDGPSVPSGPSAAPPPGSGISKAATKSSNVPVVVVNALRKRVVEITASIDELKKDLHIAAFNSRHNDHHMFFAGLAVKGPTIFPAVTEVQVTADTNDWAVDPDWTFHRIDSDAARNITGIVAPQESGTILVFVNYGSFAITFQDLAGASSAGNEIETGTGADIAVPTGGSIRLWYDGDSTVWRVW